MPPGKTALPGLPALYGRAALQALRSTRVWPGAPGEPAAELPSAPLSLAGVHASADRLARYRAVCGYGPGADLPATYPHVLAFPLQLALMTASWFPLPAIGLVHLSNSIVRDRRMSTGDAVDLVVLATDLRPHPRGRQVTVVTQASVAGEVVWREDSVFLSRDRSGPPGRSAAPSGLRSDAAGPPGGDEVVGPTQWRLPAGLGRRYAAVSGDRNPIHLFDLTAKPFGLRHHIAHGMWAKARALAELAGLLPDRVRVEVTFRRPLTLPSTVQFSAREQGTRIDFAVTAVPSEPSGPPPATHLAGTVTGL